ncbi:hypothetical protein ACFX13_026440 [Malus domestica]
MPSVWFSISGAFSLCCTVTTEFSAALQRVGDFDHASYTPHRSLPSLLRDPSDPCFLIFSISALRSFRPLILYPISLAFKR